ncbi:MAG: hypothetical protein MI919_21555, partial [Holophagales bacterium]|nr:hypothetical protein [Holophagales bacterium]
DARLRWALSAPAAFGPGHLMLGSSETPWEALPERPALLRALSRETTATTCCGDGAAGKYCVCAVSARHRSQLLLSSPRTSQSSSLPRLRRLPTESTVLSRLSCPAAGDPTGAGRSLAVTLRCATEGELAGGVVDDLELLRRLDLDHTITVEWVLEEPCEATRAATSPDGASERGRLGSEKGRLGSEKGRLETLLRAARSVADAGLETRLRLRRPAKAESPEARAELETLFTLACEAGIADVVAERTANGSALGTSGATASPWSRRLEALRLRYGFPRALPSRG